MSNDTDADSGEAPDAVDRPRWRRVDSLPGPRLPSIPAALGAPSPTVDSPPERTPAAEVTVAPGSVFVTVELAGAPRDALDIQATDTSLRVVAPRVGAPTYRLEVELPVRVEPGSAQATYRNGILDVTLKRANPSRGEPE